MNAIVGLGITAILIFGGFVLKNSKVFFLIQSIWILILICFNTQSADFLNTQALYNEITPASIRSEGFFMNGYYLLAVIAKNMGIDFIAFNGILSAITTMLIIYLIVKLSNNICIPMSFFMFYPLVSSVIQKRWYIAMFFLILACYFLLKCSSKIVGSFYFVLFIALACQFHTASLYFFTLVIFYWIPDKYKKLASILGLIILSFLKNQLSAILQSAGNESLAGKSEFYFGTLASNNMWHYIFWMIWQLLFVLLILYLLKKEYIIKLWGNRFSYYLKVINLWSLWIIPLYSFDPVFSRLFRVVLLFNYIAISNLAIVKSLKIKRIYFGSIIYQCGLSFATFIIFNALAGMPFDQLVFPVFQDNIILSALF